MKTVMESETKIQMKNQMKTDMKTMPAGKFKAQCLAVMDEVQARRVSVLVTKNGRPVAKMVPLEIPEGEDPLDAFLFPGKVEIFGDILAPIHTDAENEEFFERSAQQLGSARQSSSAGQLK
jgi:prevent-host-death family protein